MLATCETATGSGVFASSRQRSVILSLLLVLITIGVYNGVSHNGFINLDDNVYLIQNEHVHAGLTLETVKWALTTYHADNWHPLTWMSHAFDWELFGRNTSGHHYMSVLFHALDAVLLFLVLEYATGFTWRSLFVAALFAVHPVNVESVAWAAERKNVLSMMFFLLALIAYGWYAQRPSVRRYGAMALLYALGLMAKPQIITFPFVLLLWDYWPLRRFGARNDVSSKARFVPATFWRLVIEKIPLFLISAVDAWVTMRAQHNAVTNMQGTYSLPVRFANALVSYAQYVRHAVWPVGLSPAYPHPGNTLPLWQVVAAGAFLVLTSFIAIKLRKPYFLIGWLWFLGILVPMIGVVQVGDQGMADRYGYIPLIGLFWIAAWSTAELWARWQFSRRWLAVPAMLVIAAAAFLTARQVTHWRDSETLWRYTLTVTPERNFMAHNYLAGILTQENRHEEAIQEYLTAEKLHKYPLTQVVYFADYELRHGHLADAMAHAQRILEGTNDPSARELAYRDLGIAYTQLAKPVEARENYEQALKIDSRDSFALMGMGLLAYRETDFSSASEYFARSAAGDPSDFNYLLLAIALEHAGRKHDSSEVYGKAQLTSSNYTEALKKAQSFLTN